MLGFEIWEPRPSLGLDLRGCGGGVVAPKPQAEARAMPSETERAILRAWEDHVSSHDSMAGHGLRLLCPRLHLDSLSKYIGKFLVISSRLWIWSILTVIPSHCVVGQRAPLLDDKQTIPTVLQRVCGELYARARCGTAQPVLGGPSMIYCSGCCPLRSPPSVTLFVRLGQYWLRFP